MNISIGSSQSLICWSVKRTNWSYLLLLVFFFSFFFFDLFIPIDSSSNSLRKEQFHFFLFCAIFPEQWNRDLSLMIMIFQIHWLNAVRKECAQERDRERKKRRVLLIACHCQSIQKTNNITKETLFYLLVIFLLFFSRAHTRTLARFFSLFSPSLSFSINI